MDAKKQKQIKIAIAVLSVLLVISIAVLAGVFIYRKTTLGKQTKVTVSDNAIVPAAQTETTTAEPLLTVQPTESATAAAVENPSSTQAAHTTTTAASAATEPTAAPADDTPTSAADTTTAQSTDPGITLPQTQNPSSTVVDIGKSSDNDKDHLQDNLHIYIDNEPFKVLNFLPGDAESHYYGLNVYHDKTIDARFQIAAKPWDAKLMEVLKVKILMLNKNQVIYDGLISDLPYCFNYTLDDISDDHISELFYGVSIYLDTDVGNEYQNLPLEIDLHWWIEGEEGGDIRMSGIGYISDLYTPDFNPPSDNPTSDNPTSDNPTEENPTQGTSTQDETTTKKDSIAGSIIDEVLSPQTGGTKCIVFYTTVAAASLAMLLILLRRTRKGENADA